MEAMISQFVMDLVYLVLTFAGTWTLTHIVRYMKDKIKREYADRAVCFVEQVFTDIKGTDKYDEAVKWFVARMAQYKIKVSEEEVKGLLEGSLRKMKDEYSKQW
ncbi:phage holin, LLH family [Brevibacillus sp. NRS-1366]|uniref:phage holin, LLH family n=1 Tax=Brevibacillus sp. NRS-1366 TaxID=3233899 RepID=UPI003D22B91D